MVVVLASTLPLLIPMTRCRLPKERNDCSAILVFEDGWTLPQFVSTVRNCPGQLVLADAHECMMNAPSWLWEKRGRGVDSSQTSTEAQHVPLPTPGLHRGKG